MSGDGRAARAAGPAEGPPRGRGDPASGASLGLLAMLPQLLAYEVALAGGGGRRNTAELMAGLALRPLGEGAHTARRALFALFALLALWSLRRRGVRVGPGLARVVLEGLALAVLFGPLLVLAMAGLRRLVPQLAPLEIGWTPDLAPELVPAALVFGGAAWEEIVFRLGVYSLAYLLALRAASAFGLGRAARVLAEVAGLGLSSLLFALAHMEILARRLGAGGLAFEPAHFTWLVLAGILLGIVFRLRGPGVAAWAHGAFNVGLLLGVDPDIVL